MAAIALPSTYDLAGPHRPALRLVAGGVGGGASRSHRADVVRRQRRALVAAGTALACTALWLGMSSMTATATARPDAAARLSMAPVAANVHIVQPGDSLWTIARSLQPDGDIRPLVDRLAGTRRGRPLQVGERIRA